MTNHKRRTNLTLPMWLTILNVARDTRKAMRERGFDNCSIRDDVESAWAALVEHMQ